MRFLFLSALALALAACDATTDPFVCTEEFVSIQVEVVDAAGRPLEGLTARSVNERTGEALAGARDSGETREADDPGVYTVATDADARRLRVDGDPVLFTASGDGVEASARFVLADNGCHVVKEEGPDRVTATRR